MVVFCSLACSLALSACKIFSFSLKFWPFPIMFLSEDFLKYCHSFSELSESKDWFFFFLYLSLYSEARPNQASNYLNSITRDQGSVTFSCRGSEQKYVLLCCPYGPRCNYSTLLFFCKTAIDNTLTNGCGCWREWQYTIQTMPLWHMDYFEVKGTEKWQMQGELPTLPLSAQEQGIHFLLWRCPPSPLLSQEELMTLTTGWHQLESAQTNLIKITFIFH